MVSRVNSSSIVGILLVEMSLWQFRILLTLMLFFGILNCHVEDYFMLASDRVNVLHKKCYMGNLAMKIDIRKALTPWISLLSVELFRPLGFVGF